MENYSVVCHDDSSGNTYCKGFGHYRTDALDYMAREVGRLVVLGSYTILDRVVGCDNRVRSIVLTSGTSVLRFSLKEISRDSI